MITNPGLGPTSMPTPGLGSPIAGMQAAPEPDMDELGGEPIENEDGSVDFSDPEEPKIAAHEAPHDANLAEVLDEDVLNKIAADLLEGIEADKASNEEMYSIFDAGLQFVVWKPGQRLDKPFKGAAGVIHPIALEAMVRFQASARGELLPAEGPCKAQIIGEIGPQAEVIAQRKTAFLNYYLTVEDEEYVEDYDQMLMLLGFYGSMFRKVYRDPARGGKPVSRMLTPKDLLVSYSATSLAGSSRVTHIEPNVTHADLVKMQLRGWYADVDLGAPDEAADDEESEKTRALTEGREESERPEDATYNLYHCHALIDVEGLEHRDGKTGEETGLPIPYIVTIEPSSRKVLRMARNWDKQDAEYRPRDYYVHYKHTPGFGFYGWGFIHLLGSVADALTMMRRQAINAFTMKSFPGGVKVRGARMSDARVDVGPGQWAEVDTGGLPIGQALMPLPYSDVPPSFEPIMRELLDSGQRLGSIGDMAVGEGREDALPGTVIALIEQASKLESAVMKRLHAAQRRELRMLAKLFGADKKAKYPYAIGGQSGVALAADFQDNTNIVPVSDPNVPTRTQRLAKAQGILQEAKQSGGLLDMRQAYQEFLRVLGMTDQQIGALMPPPKSGVPADPMTEFAAVLQGQPLKAGPMQDHAAHIQAHMGQLATPHLDKVPAYQQLVAHVGEHMGLFYAGEASRLSGIPMLPGQVPPQMEAQVTAAVAAATNQLRISMAQFATPNGDPLVAEKLRLEAEKLRQNDVKMKLDAAEQDRKAEQTAQEAHEDRTKLAATLADNEAQRQSEAATNQNETMRSLISLRQAQISAGADAMSSEVERDGAVAEKLIDHASERVRSMADVKVAEHSHAAAHEQAAADVKVAAHETEAEAHRVRSEQAKATQARARAKRSPKK